MLSCFRESLTHYQVHLGHFFVSIITVALFTSVVFAQFGMETVADQDLGRPPQAPFITFLGIVSPGTMAVDPSLPLNGSVAEVLHEELRVQETPAGPAGEVVASIRTMYDDQGRPIEEWNAEMHTVNRYQGTRLVSKESTFLNSKRPVRKFWNYWVYDESGKLTEYRRGSGDALQNHLTNFKHDEHGRLTSFEYRQGAKDELLSRTEFRYSSDGKTVDYTFYDAAGEVTRSKTETMDDRGHVVSAVIRERDWKTKAPKTPLKIAFTYDKKGRLVDQNTDLHEFERSGSEHELPPGKISITYDDVNRTKTTAYSSDEGPLALTLTYDAGGATIGIAGGTTDHSLDTMLECTFDSHQNWISCRQMVKSGGVSTISRMWRRTITYR